jgi:hypothetical protein
MFRMAVVGMVLWASAAAADLPLGEQVLHTKDGRELRGVVVSQTQTGYVLKTATGTQLVPFADIQDLLPAEGAAPGPLPPPPPPPPQEPPPPGYEYPPPPPPQQPAPAEEPPPPEAPGPDWRSARKGFHWSLGAGGMIDPGFGGTSTAAPTLAYMVGAVPAVRWGFGWLDVQAELMPMGYFRGATQGLFLGLNPQMRINFVRWYSLGVGLYGAVVFSHGIDFCVGPSISPAIFRIGELGQHELRFWTSTTMLATSSGLQGVLLMMLSYSYVF